MYYRDDMDDAPLTDDDLPGMWSHADFEGGDPDTRSYAQRERDRTNVDHCSCPPDHPAHQKSLRTSENGSTVVA